MRLDKLPMDQVRNAAGQPSLYARYETDPNFVHEQQRRQGSLRQSQYAPAPGYVFTGRASRAQYDRTVAGASAFTVGFSLLTGDIATVGGEVPLVTLRASRDASTTTDSFRLYLKRASLSSYVLGIKAIDGTPATVSDETFAVTVDTAYDLAFRWNGADLTVTDGTTTKTVTPAGAFTGPYYLDIGGDKFTSVKAKSRDIVIANVGVDATYISDTSTIFGVRDPGVYDGYWTLDGTEAAGILAADEGTGFLLGYPAAPQLVSSALQFSSESGAFQIEHTPEYDRFFQTTLKSVGDSKFTFTIKGTRGVDTNRNVILLDYGDLARVEILNSAGSEYVRFTYNGTAVTTSVAVGTGTAFEIFAGRDGADLFLQVATTVGTATAPAVPYLDLARIPNLYVGAEEDPAADTRYLGNLTKFALWPAAVKRDVGADAALFYFDFTAAEPVEDTSLNNVPAALIPHTAEGGGPLYAAGPLSDATFPAVVGGSVLGRSGPVGYDNRLARRIGTDAAGLRVGYRGFVASGNRAHVINHELDRTRPLGLPKPGADVTVQAVGTGALDGAYLYGYQWESADGTLGPVKRLQPVVATDGSRVILGSSDGAGGTVGSELDETFGRNYPTSAGAGDRFGMDWDAAPADGTYTTEVRGRFVDMDDDDLEELVHHRGVTANDGSYVGNTLYFSTDIPTHSFNINSNWTVQTVFEYHKPRDTGNPMTAFGLWGVGKTERLTGGTSYPTYNQDFVAFFLDGRNDAGGEVSDWYQTTQGRDHYGDSTTGPKLVVGVPRQERRESWYASGRRLALNYALLTFTNDPTWTEGSTYDIVFQRDGQAVKVYYRNLTAGDTDYTQLTARTMDALPSRTGNSGKTIPAKSSYDGDSLFTGYRPLTDARDFHFGTACDYHLPDIPFIGGTTTSGSIDGNADPALGQVDEADYTTYTTNTYTASGGTNFNQVKPSPGGSDGCKHFHYRVWNRKVSTVDLRRDGLKRSAALPGEPLNYGIYIDLGCVIEDETKSTDKLTDKASGMIWFAKNEAGTGASSSPSAETLSHALATTAALNPTFYPLAMFGTINASFANADLKLYVSPFGDGSYTLQTRGGGQFNLRSKIWSSLTTDPLTTKLIGSFQSFISDWDQFKTHSFGLVILDDGGTNKYIGADSWAINGNTIFKSTVGVTSSETVADSAFTNGTGWIALAGFLDSTATATWQTDVSEFRVWSPGYGPDVQEGTGFKYVSGRVAESDHANMEVYIKFQPEDEVAGSPVTLTNYGTQAPTAGLAERGNADIVDTRTQTGSGSDPAPKVAFPAAPFEDVTGLWISRSASIPINDPDDEDEVQNALNAARGAPLYRLGRLPAGATHYIDAAPDGALGFEVALDEGQVPQVVTAVGEWDRHLALLTGDHDIWFSERGNTGWETYPNAYRHRPPVSAGGGPGVALVEAGGLLFLFGNEWAVVASGSPSAPHFTTVGAGAGAYSARCAVAYSNMVFAYNGTLWAFADGQPVNFGLPVQDELPTAANARLCVSSELASLFLIDKSSGVALRYHFPTRRWSVEERDATSVGDLIAGGDAWTTVGGAWAAGSTTTYADDVNSGTATEYAGSVSGDTFTLTSGTADIPLGCRCTITQDSDGTSVVARTVTISGSPSAITFASGALTGISGACKIRPGAGATGMLLDSGTLDLGVTDARTSPSLPVHLLQGSGWEIGRYAAALPGDVTDRTVLEYTAVGTSDERLGDGSRVGRFQRITLRNRIPEQSRCTFLEIT